MTYKILVIGACGQIGSELTQKLRIIYGADNVIASDIKAPKEVSGPFEYLDVLDKEQIEVVIKKYDISDVYLMAAMLSVTAENFPDSAWDLNVNSLLNILSLAKQKKIRKVFWPSSIAAFGKNTPKELTPQYTVMEPSTVYGISKQTGERWCEYFHERYGVDVRSIRYPGLISWSTPPGGGTTDYAVDIFYKALESGHYECFLSADTKMPMMYMEDAVDATINIMEAPKEKIKIRSSYNLSAISFTPSEIANEIRKYLPEFVISYLPDFRQKIADSWPSSIDDDRAREDWGWSHKFNLESMTRDVLKNLDKKCS
ncbi:NAD-dependent epimerase/dehydratase family protein [uncultured Herbaspirillum sp.]|uniref:NAD-dependent epimerase/dehydratase family protein n=1 Tax=uncultured Herbaspirillum sp. TaxID=160236 RepID=UPI002585FF6A|nr:NAD-dependent epimerase/dehydratase family protein [uncultured Herbaspirillum sp.]